MSGQDAILRWARGHCERHGILVENFTTSWSDGRAFCAIVDAQSSGALGKPVSALDPTDAAENLRLAFSAAERLGVPPLLEPEDITDLEVPEPLSIITYLGALYKKFRGAGMGGPKIDLAAARRAAEARLAGSSGGASSSSSSSPPLSSSSLPARPSSSAKPAPKCALCGVTVSGRCAEVEGHSFHLDCMRCSGCRRSLAGGTQCLVVQGKPYCESCAKKAFVASRTSSKPQPEPAPVPKEAPPPTREPVAARQAVRDPPMRTAAAPRSGGGGNAFQQMDRERKEREERERQEMEERIRRRQTGGSASASSGKSSSAAAAKPSSNPFLAAERAKKQEEEAFARRMEARLRGEREPSPPTASKMEVQVEAKAPVVEMLEDSKANASSPLAEDALGMEAQTAVPQVDEVKPTHPSQPAAEEEAPPELARFSSLVTLVEVAAPASVEEAEPPAPAADEASIDAMLASMSFEDEMEAINRRREERRLARQREREEADRKFEAEREERRRQREEARRQRDLELSTPSALVPDSSAPTSSDARSAASSSSSVAGSDDADVEERRRRREERRKQLEEEERRLAEEMERRKREREERRRAMGL